METPKTLEFPTEKTIKSMAMFQGIYGQKYATNVPPFLDPEIPNISNQAKPGFWYVAQPIYNYAKHA